MRLPLHALPFHVHADRRPPMAQVREDLNARIKERVKSAMQVQHEAASTIQQEWRLTEPYKRSKNRSSLKVFARRSVPATASPTRLSSSPTRNSSPSWKSTDVSPIKRSSAPTRLMFRSASSKKVGPAQPEPRSEGVVEGVDG